MSESTIRRLAFAEWDFVAIDSKLADLARDLHLSAHDAPECAAAVLELNNLRYGLRAVLNRIDEPLTQAIKAAEGLAEAPF